VIVQSVTRIYNEPEIMPVSGRVNHTL
jgi:hypothetical protein